MKNTDFEPNMRYIVSEIGKNTILIENLKIDLYLPCELENVDYFAMLGGFYVLYSS